MWERKTDKAKWNGKVLHIQSTTLDSGKRLHVAEMPYLDLPHIKVMGAKSRTINIEAVLVGINSLVDANALVADLERNPEGSLEHPYLGELSLVFASSSQKFSTKKGIVILSLKFLRQGVPVVLARLAEKTPSELIGRVLEETNKDLAEKIQQASPEQIDSMKLDLTAVVNVLRNIANRSTLSSFKLARLHREVEDAFTAIEALINAPSTYSQHLSAIINSLKHGSNSEYAIKALTDTINPTALYPHSNLHITLAVVALSQEVATLSHIETVDEQAFVTQPLSKMQNNIMQIQGLLSERLNDVATHASFESMALVDAVVSLQENVNKQAGKLMQYQETLKTIEVVSARPLLCIAQSEECTASLLNRLNEIHHPLFVVGELQVKNA